MAKPISRSLLAIGAVFLIILAAVAVAAVVYLIPGVEAQLPPTSAFDLTIAEPYDEATIFLDDNVNVRVDTHTSPVPAWMEDKFITDLGNDKYELWVDGHYVTEQEGDAPSLDRGRYAYTLWIPWEASTPGSHILMVRGKNKFWNGVSNVVHVKVVDLASISRGDSYLPLPGESLETIATKFGISPILLGAANPGIPSFQGPLGAGKPIYFPKAFEPIDTPPQDDIPVGDNGNFTGGKTEPPLKPINKIALWVELGLSKAGFIKDGPPAAPTLFRFKSGCDVTLYVKDNSNNELGFYLYRLDPGSTTFKRIATFGPHAGDKFIEYTDKGLYGRYQYYAAAFNAQGESVDSFMTVEFWDKGCLNPEMAAYKLDQVTFTSKVSADKIYCYYSFQEGYWSRVPEDPNAFLYPTSNGYDLTRELSDLALSPQSQLNFDCWGWQGGSLISLGAGNVKMESDAGKPLQVGGDDFAISGVYMPISNGSIILKGEIPEIKPPYNLRNTSVLDTCEKHFPNTGFESLLYAARCADAVKLKEIILVWGWDSRSEAPTPYESAKSYVTDISGYKVYQEYPGGKRVMIREIPDPKQTALILPAVSFTSGNPTFVVRAYKGANSSPDSNHFTLTSETSGLATITIAPLPNSKNDISYYVTTTERIEGVCDYEGTGGPKLGIGADEIKVGFYHESKTCVDVYDVTYVGSLVFDLSPVIGAVSNATLSYAQGETLRKDDEGFLLSPLTSCAYSLNIITDFARGARSSKYSYWSGGVNGWDPYRLLPTAGYPGAIHKVDVTEAIRDWMLGAPNLGFAFIGRDETTPDDASDACWSKYNMFSLTVTYFITSE